jgi:hypothetical protein
MQMLAVETFPDLKSPHSERIVAGNVTSVDSYRYIRLTRTYQTAETEDKFENAMEVMAGFTTL